MVVSKVQRNLGVRNKRRLADCSMFGACWPTTDHARQSAGLSFAGRRLIASGRRVDAQDFGLKRGQRRNQSVESAFQRSQCLSRVAQVLAAGDFFQKLCPSSCAQRTPARRDLCATTHRGCATACQGSPERNRRRSLRGIFDRLQLVAARLHSRTPRCTLGRGAQSSDRAPATATPQSRIVEWRASSASEFTAARARRQAPTGRHSEP